MVFSFIWHSTMFFRETVKVDKPAVIVFMELPEALSDNSEEET